MASRDPYRPNILFVLTDDQGYWAMGCAGNNEVRTPTLDYLARIGIRFENFFCTSPVCSPARASILTGKIPSQHGVHDWIRIGNSTIEREKGYKTKLIEYLKDHTTYTEILVKHNYICGISGKWHLGNAHKPQKGFTYWKVHAKGGGPYYNAPMIKKGKVYYEKRYITDVITDEALAFLKQQLNNNQPFYLSVHYTAPHTPLDRNNHPKDLYDEYYNYCKFKSVPKEEPPTWVKAHSFLFGQPSDPEEHRRKLLSGYFTAITAMDRNLGRIISFLEKNNLLSNTLIFFTSDNGMNMGHHGIYGKGNGTFPINMFDTSVKVPMIIARPGHIKEGIVCKSLLSHYDIFPTLLEYLEIPYSGKNLPGNSFANILIGKKIKEKTSICVYDEYGPVRMIRTQKWKYIHRYPYGPNELYNLEKDPNEKKNLVEHPKYKRIVEKMKYELEQWFMKYVDPRIDGIKESVNGRGQIELAGIYAKGKVNYYPYPEIL